MQAQTIAIPPEALRYRIHGSADVESFLQVGEQCSKDIIAALRQIDRDLSSFEAILDFGCGCGRTLRWFELQTEHSRFFGADIDREAIAWCGQHLTRASFLTNGSLPPSGFAADSFDLIYAISVFTHLDEEYQFCWLYELQRITKPSGIVLISTHGDAHINNVPPELATEIRKRGMFFLKSGGWRGMFPAWYQDSFHTKEYILREYSTYFDILDYIPQAINRLQDLVILQKPFSRTSLIQPELPALAQAYRLERRLADLEEVIKQKNQHIVGLESLIQQIESGKLMKFLNFIQRKL
jgi:SAM-dependent methyltransferase